MLTAPTRASKVGSCSALTPNDLLARAPSEDNIRLNIGEHTIIVQREGEETIAVVLLTGHPAIKSLRRTIRRAARK